MKTLPIIGPSKYARMKTLAKGQSRRLSDSFVKEDFMLGLMKKVLIVLSCYYLWKIIIDKQSTLIKYIDSFN